jgi:hypothetical protein
MISLGMESLSGRHTGPYAWASGGPGPNDSRGMGVHGRRLLPPSCPFGGSQTGERDYRAQWDAELSQRSADGDKDDKLSTTAGQLPQCDGCFTHDALLVDRMPLYPKPLNGRKGALWKRKIGEAVSSLCILWQSVAMRN